VGVDGGATKCTVRLEDEAGHLIGRETSGPANIRLSVQQTWRSIYSAFDKIIKAHQLNLEDHFFHVGIGIAGSEMQTARHDFIAQAPAFTTLVVSSDAHIACLGAHGNKDGAIIIAGTGSIGYQLIKGEPQRAGGWGFPYDDEGGGAWLGLRAMMYTLQAIDHRRESSPLTQALFTHFKKDITYLADWANKANSTLFAELAPFVTQYAEQGDQTAQHILQEAADAISRIGMALFQIGKGKALPCALIGGVTPYLQPLVDEALRSRLCQPLAPPDAGAILLVKNVLAKEKKHD